MEDYNTINYEPIIKPKEKPKDDCSGAVMGAMSIVGIAFIIAMCVLMTTMINILTDMDNLMKQTTGNTYEMCKFMKILSMDNTTVCHT